jgi:hypothetical protein
VSAFGCRNERPNLDQLSYIEPELAYISAAAVAHERSCKRRAKARDEVYIRRLRMPPTKGRSLEQVDQMLSETN